ncbi:hypothetical protein VTI74DRAFT_10544 [Chaetomium olivicolor]
MQHGPLADMWSLGVMALEWLHGSRTAAGNVGCRPNEAAVGACGANATHPAPRVLVTTVGIIAEGLNLARANYLVLLGPLGTSAKQLQVGCRINREGGLFTPHLALLLDPDSKAEMAVRWRQLNRAAIETEVWAGAR